MQKKTGIRAEALRYRVATKEFAGVLVALAAGAIAYILLHFLKINTSTLYASLIFLGVLLLQFIFVYLISYLEYKNLKYLIEPNSISLQTGTFSIDTETIPFEKIKNSSYTQSLIQRIFSVGDIIIDQDDEKFIWDSIDSNTANLIMEAVSAKSNVQPITITMANPETQNPLTPPTTPIKP